MITKDTAVRIAYAYSEIESAQQLLASLENANGHYEIPDFRDAFGRQRGLQLGVPSSVNGHRLMDVSPKLAAIIIRAHIDDKRAEIEALCEIAQNELSKATS